MEDKTSAIAEKCRECGLCSRACPLLAELGESPKRLAERGITAQEAFSCTLCGACEAVCPFGLSPMEMFAAGRRRAAAAGESGLDECRYLFPDRPNNLMSVYRRHSGIDYGDLAPRGAAACAFFPGCTLMTYAPGLTRDAYARLQDACGCSGLITECCGKPLTQLGLAQRADAAAAGLLAHLEALRVRELIVACPGCYYELRPILRRAGIGLRTIYETLGDRLVGTAGGKLCTVHDSCPDRLEGIFGRQVRDLLAKSGFALVAMEHSQKCTICCGSGGMVSHFRPDRTEELVGMRVREAQATGAEVLVSYCVSCTLKFAAAADGFSADHALGLLLGRREDYGAAKAKVAAMLEGPQGAALWAEIMAD
jgi:Fe-S oxidoreductase